MGICQTKIPWLLLNEKILSCVILFTDQTRTSVKNCTGVSMEPSDENRVYIKGGDFYCIKFSRKAICLLENRVGGLYETGLVGFNSGCNPDGAAYTSFGQRAC
jgi:hypothetical protein